MNIFHRIEFWFTAWRLRRALRIYDDLRRKIFDD